MVGPEPENLAEILKQGDSLKPGVAPPHQQIKVVGLAIVIEIGQSAELVKAVPLNDAMYPLAVVRTSLGLEALELLGMVHRQVMYLGSFRSTNVGLPAVSAQVPTLRHALHDHRGYDCFGPLVER